MMEMLGLCLLLLHPLVLAVAGQEEAIQLLHLHEPSPLTPQSLSSLPHTKNPPSIAVSVCASDLLAVSSSVLTAEAWLKTHVLAHFPSIKISTIVAGKGVLCSSHHEQLWSSVLPSVKNLHYSLMRWGLVKEIKMSASFSSDCFQHTPFPSSLKPLLSFIQDTGSVYTIDQPLHSSHLLSDHQAALARLGFSGITNIRVAKELKPISRRLSSMTFPSIPELPKPSELLAPAARNPLPPPLQFAPVPDGSFSFPPDTSPTVIPANPPDASVVPPSPCPATGMAPAPVAGEDHKGGLWCVAKPTVPAEKLQEAMDYACGEGGADCEEIMPNGKCYYPDNLVAHASFAYNSYWQKTKKTGGTCSFDGTALLINSDPSFLQCRFQLA